MTLTQLESKLRTIYIEGQNYNPTAVQIIDNLKEGNTKQAAAVYAKHYDRIPGWEYWGEQFKATILENATLIGLEK